MQLSQNSHCATNRSRSLLVTVMKRMLIVFIVSARKCLTQYAIGCNCKLLIPQDVRFASVIIVFPCLHSERYWVFVYIGISLIAQYAGNAISVNVVHSLSLCCQVQICRSVVLGSSLYHLVDDRL